MLVLSAVRAPAANFGTLVPIVGQFSDVAYDERRDVVYLANYALNRVDVYSVAQRRIVNSINTGPQPDSLTLSTDRQTLWVASQQASALYAINLNTSAPAGEYPLQVRPDAITTGSDGKVLVYGSSGLMRFDPVAKELTQLVITPPPVRAPGTVPAQSPLPQGFRAALTASQDGKVIVGIGVDGTGNAPPMRLFVYEVASGTVLRSRDVSGLSSILSIAPDGSRFMAGPFLFDTNTLTILGRTGYLPPNNVQLTGGSVFSADGNYVFASFATQTPIHPLNTNQPAFAGTTAQGGTAATRGVLQVLNGWNLTPQLGLRLPESPTSIIIRSRDGQNLFALSASGLLVIPVGQLDRSPILDVDSTSVVLTADVCSRAVVTAAVQVRNAGAGRATFSAVASGATNAALTIRQTSSVAPATLQITFDSRRANLNALGTGQYSIVLSSPEAVNVEPAIVVNLNFRDVDQRGSIVPIDGLGTDMLLDEARQRLYIANFLRDRVDVFSLAERRFLAPIAVGSQPMSMAQVSATTLVVANSGAEFISVVDLEAMQEVDRIMMAPVPLNATPQFPRSIAVSPSAILFTTMAIGQPGQAPGNGNVWQLSLATRNAFPRRNLGENVANSINGRNLLIAPANGSAIVLADASGTLRYYDPGADTFAITRAGAIGGYRGTAAAAADGSYYVFDNTVFNSVLTQRGSIAPSGVTAAQAASLGVAAAGNMALRVQAATSQITVERLQLFDSSSLQQRDEVRLAEIAMDITPGSTSAPTAQVPPGTVIIIMPTPTPTPAPGGGTTPTPGGGTPVQPPETRPGAGGETPIQQPGTGGIITGGTTTTSTALPRIWPPASITRLFGAQGQTQLFRTGVVADSQNNVYMLTVSGLSVVSTTQASRTVPSFSSAGVVNGASFKGPVAPGSIVSIFGANLGATESARQLPLPTMLGGVCVTANQTSVPLFYTSPTQINAQLPAELATGRVTLTVRSRDTARVSSSVAVQVNAAAPGVFTMSAEGRTQAALFHADDFTPVTPKNPGKRDKDLILFATGLGRVNPAVASGAAASDKPLSATSQEVTVTIGGHGMIVSYAGLAPGYVGLYQINLRVPGDRVQGDSLPVAVTIGGVSSASSSATIASIH
ncbi:MAG: hypothetical protein NTZ98_05865 [Acidobacteria bacterium]|nr:hypothetical protein [Acidobacteriota bacterium]